jgi:aspartyl-tRNA(Asn)/glutamyl-tRNA(Gln) amidotransferase subunit B
MIYEMVIGLEVHAQLSTESKLFCNCSIEFGKEPNENTCPVCMGYPGVLPVLNTKAVDYAVKAGLALDCEIDPKSKFDRKQYFYPDLPKGYQISQWDKPLCKNGKLHIEGRDIGIVRIHMEEDAGKLVHAGDGSETEADRLFGSDYSLIDLNRAGTPLIEIVSAPDIRSADEAISYVKELRKILLYLGVCDGNMQEGSLRCDVNISLRKPGAGFGTRAEIKNVNSFRSVGRAIEFEFKRQSQILDKGEKVVQETRLFEESSGKTFSMRSKEDAHDYRYFPEPDLVPIHIERETVEQIKKNLPELPLQKRSRYMTEFSLNEEVATLLTEDYTTAKFFEDTVLILPKNQADAPRKAANWLNGNIAAYINERKINIHQTKLSPALLAQMVTLIEEGTISDNIAKNDIIIDLLERGTDVQELIQSKGLAQITDTAAIETVIKEVLAKNTAQVEQFKSGNQKIKGFLVGRIMKETQGKASPQIINKILDTLL